MIEDRRHVPILFTAPRYVDSTASEILERVCTLHNAVWSSNFPDELAKEAALGGLGSAPGGERAESSLNQIWHGGPSPRPS